MRIGVVLEVADDGDPLASLAEQASAAEREGMALGWLEPGPESGPPLITVAALAAHTSSLLLAARVRPEGATHPLELAASATVADNSTAGRLIFALDAGGDEELASELADVLQAAFAPRPFVHAGRRWRIPANRAENELVEERQVVTPPPAQIEVPVWLVGTAVASAAHRRALPVVAADDEDSDAIAPRWELAEQALGPAVLRLRRPALRTVPTAPDGDFDDDALVERLRSEQRTWGLDVAVLRLVGPRDDRARRRAIARIATHVKPRVVLHELPAGLEAYWAENLAAQIAAVGRPSLD